MLEWYWIAAIAFCGFVLGALVAALFAVSRCNDCEIIGRIWSGMEK